jgi:hypothetical protein
MSDRLLVLVAGVLVALLVSVTRFAPAPAYLGMAAAGLLSGFLMHRAAGLSLRRLSLPSVWYLSYLAGTAIPACFVAAEPNRPYVIPFMTAVVATLFTAPLGILLVNSATGFGREEIRAFYQTPVERRDPVPSEVGTYLVFLGACLALTAAYLIETPVIPILYLIRNPGSAALLVTMREESFKLLDSPLIYAYDVTRNVAYPFFVALSLGYWLVTRRARWLVLFLMTAAAGLLYAAISIAKAPVAVIVLVMGLMVYLHRGGRVNLSGMALGLAGVFLFPVAVLYRSLSGLGVSAGEIMLAILRRLFYLPAEILYNYFVVVPDIMGHLHGRTIGRVQWVLGEEGFDIGNFVFRFMYPSGNPTGVANTSFLGYLHADFGLPGILFGGALVGVLVQSLQLWLTRRPKTVTTLAAYAFLLWAAWKINFQALPQVLLSGGVIVVLVLVQLLRLTESFFRVATGRPRRALVQS